MPGAAPSQFPFRSVFELCKRFQSGSHLSSLTSSVVNYQIARLILFAGQAEGWLLN